MTAIRLTKTELRQQQYKLAQLKHYLPTLQLKKAMLQQEVYRARAEAQTQKERFAESSRAVAKFFPLLEEKLSIGVRQGSEVSVVNKSYENIAGVELPVLEGVEFALLEYTLFDTPPWVDEALIRLREQAEAHIRLEVAREKVMALEVELREVSIRVNLFQKVLIPRTESHIKKIQIFLGDQQLASVAQAKVAKAKIEERSQSRA